MSDGSTGAFRYSQGRAGVVARGHTEQDCRLPEGLPRLPWWNPGAWALPSVTISGASMCVFLGDFLYFQHSAETRMLLRLPSPAVLALSGAGLTSLVALRGARRPGPLMPRIWALSLTILCFSCAALSVVWPDQSALHAWALSGLLASLALSARHLPVHPDRDFVRWLPILVVSVLGMGILGAWVGVDQARAKALGRVEAAVRVLQNARDAGLANQGQRWDTLISKDQVQALPPGMTKLDAARTALDTIDGGPNFTQGFSRIHELAAVLQGSGGAGPDQRLMSAYAEATAAVGQAMVSDAGKPSGPLMSSFAASPPQFYDPELGRWVLQEGLDARSHAVYAYGTAVNALTSTLLSVRGVGAAEDSAQDLDRRKATLVAAMKGTFADDWGLVAIGEPPQPRHWGDLLALQLLSGDPSTQGADLYRQWRRTLVSARQLASAETGCKELSYLVSWRGAAQTRLDCYLLIQHEDAEMAQVALELRMVYETSGSRAPPDDSTPVELYYLYMVPGADGVVEPGQVSMEKQRAWVEDAMDALIRQARAIYTSPGNMFRATSMTRTGQWAGGTTLNLNGDEIYLCGDRNLQYVPRGGGTHQAGVGIRAISRRDGGCL